jgi:hypothetical protein
LIHKYAPHASLRRFVTKKLNHDAIAMARFFSGLLGSSRQHNGNQVALLNLPLAVARILT